MRHTRSGEKLPLRNTVQVLDLLPHRRRHVRSLLSEAGLEVDSARQLLWRHGGEPRKSCRAHRIQVVEDPCPRHIGRNPVRVLSWRPGSEQGIYNPYVMPLRGVDKLGRTAENAVDGPVNGAST